MSTFGDFFIFCGVILVLIAVGGWVICRIFDHETDKLWPEAALKQANKEVRKSRAWKW